MFGFKWLAVAALVCAVAANETCAAPVTVTVTVSECGGQPVNPAPTPPASVAPPAPPASSVESTATAPLSGDPGAPHSTDPAPAPPVSGPPAASPTEAPVVPVVPSSGGAPGVSASDVVTSPGHGPSSAASQMSTTLVHTSTTAANLHPSSSGAPEISTAGAPLATPLANMGSLLVAGAAAAMAVMV